MIKAPKKTLIIILIINLILLIIISFFVLQIKEKKFELISVLAGTSSQEQLLIKLEPQLVIIDNYFLSASTTVEFLERLEATAKLTKTNFKINRAEAKDDLRLNFSVQGSFLAVNQFLVLLEKFPYALRLERLAWRMGDEGLWQGEFVILVKTQNN